MDNKLKKLAQQAGFGLRDGELYTAKLEHLPITENIETFAQSIINECARLCTTQYRTMDGWGITGSDQRCADLIKQHFGVEE